ncbi:MAG: response regulator [Chloroflexota bacterium]|nr:response regulator [Chloroflexota bacterium]
MSGTIPGSRIAVINDDTAFLDLMRDLLEDESYAVMICREWDHAYEFVKTRRPDLVILDIRLGGEERGWNILNLLTLDPTTRPTPLIVCSAAVQSLHDHQELLTRYGIRALPKPFDVDALLRTVEETLLDRRQERPI